MKNPIRLFLREIVYEAVVSVLKQGHIPSGEPLEWYSEDILLQALTICTAQCLKEGGRSLRKSERKLLLNLQQNLEKRSPLLLIEKQLAADLVNIKPIWGEVFGTDRGKIYNAFKGFWEWPCFSWQMRLHYHSQRAKRHAVQVHTFSAGLARQANELETASQLLRSQQAMGSKAAQQLADQFITIQALRVENDTLKKAATQ